MTVAATTSPTSSRSPAGKQEEPQSHRVYWQQRLSVSTTSNSNSRNSSNSNNNLITGSAAVKISHSAKASDLTNLLRKTLNLGNSSNDENNKDSLVLVGTLRAVPTDYVRFEHEAEPPRRHGGAQHDDDDDGAVNLNQTAGSMEDFHMVKTLDEDDHCLSVLQEMKSHLLERQNAIDRKITKARQEASPKRRNVLSLRPTIAPQTRLYYVPDTTNARSPSKPQQKQQPTMTSCLELDGYLTSFDDQDSDDDYDEHDCGIENDNNNDPRGIGNEGKSSEPEAMYGDDEDLLRRALAPFDDDSDEENEELKRNDSIDTVVREGEKLGVNGRQWRRRRANPSAIKSAREWRRYLEISQSHAAVDKQNAGGSTNPSNATLAGYVLKRSSTDPHVWKRHYCVLTLDYFWYVPRVVRSDEFLLEEASPFQLDNGSSFVRTETIEIAQTHGRISLAETTLILPHRPETRIDGFELVGGDGKSHRFRACSRSNASAGAATRSSIAAARAWRGMLQTRIRDSRENSLTKLAELLVTEETVARNDRWRHFLAGGNEHETGAPSLCKIDGETSMLYCSSANGDGDDESNDESNDESRSSLLRSRVLHYGLEVAEFKEGCRQIQTLLWANVTGRSSTRDSSSSSVTMGAIHKLVKELWREASALLDKALQLNDAIVGSSSSSTTTTTSTNPSNHHRRGLETLCHHIEYVITQKRRRPSRSSLKESSSYGSLGDSTKSESSSDLKSVGDRKQQSAVAAREDYPHQRDPPPIDLFDLLWKELRTLG